MTRPKGEPLSCSVANSNCRCPANLEDRPRLRATCWHCGLPVCTDRGCSTMREFHPGALADAVAILRTELEDEEDGQNVADAVLERARGWTEFWMTSTDGTY